jgi:hypothetical protein
MHWPSAHEAVPLVREQRCPQVPQFRGLVRRSISQPSVTLLLLQSPLPSAQSDTPQIPATQLGTPPATGQALPQAWQLRASELMFVSHPLSGLPSQSSNPEAHGLVIQVLPTQLNGPFSFRHLCPHLPQLSVVARLVSQPSSMAPLQSANPGSQSVIEQ